MVGSPGDPFPGAVQRDITNLQAFQEFVRGIDGRGGDSQRVNDPYAQLVTVFAGVRLIAMSLSRVPFELWRGDADGAEVVGDGPLRDLFDRPNPAMTWRKLIETFVIHLHSGDAFFYVFEPEDITEQVPAQLQLIPPQMISPIPDPEDLYRILGWELKVKGGKRILPADKVIRIEYAPSTANPYVGQSPFEAARLGIETEQLAGVYQKVTLQSGGSPGALFNYKGEGDLPEKDRRRIEDKFVARYGVPRGSRVAVLGGDWEYTNLGFRPRDMEFLQLRKFSLGEFARMLNIPPLYLAHFEGASGLSDAGLRVQERILYNQNIIPLASKVADAINTFIIHPIDPTIEGTFNFDQVEALRDDLGAKATVAVAMSGLQVPFRDINDRLDLGFDTQGKPWLEDPLVSAGLVTASSAVEGSTFLPVPDAAEGEPAGPREPAEPAPAGDIKTQETVLNGAQVQAAMQLVQSITTGGLPRDSVQGMLEVMFNLSAEEAEKMIGSADYDPSLAQGAEGETRGVGDDGIPLSEDQILDLLEEAVGHEEIQRAAKKKKASTSKRKRAAIQRSFVKDGRTVSNEMAGKITRVMNKQRRLVLKALIKAAGGKKAVERSYAELFADADVMQRGLDLSKKEIRSIISQIKGGTVFSAIKPSLEKAYRRGSKAAAAELAEMGVPAKDLTNFQKDRLPELVSDYFDARIGVAESIDDVTREAVNRTIVKGIEKGRTVTEIAKDIRGVFNVSINRSRTIARTETNTAMNGARFETMQEQGIERHMWMTVMDGDARELHAGLNGKIVDVGTEFAPGLKFPGDPDAAVGDIVNCRCTIAPVTAVLPESAIEAQQSQRAG